MLMAGSLKHFQVETILKAGLVVNKKKINKETLIIHTIKNTSENHLNMRKNVVCEHCNSTLVIFYDNKG